MKLFFIIYFIINVFNIIPGEYFINKNPSFLYKKFDNITYEIFPSDIRINISLSDIDGDLLYSFDKNYNQFIVTIIEVTGASIKMKFRNIEYISSINELCGCERCRYKILNFRIQIREQLMVQCNGGEAENFTYDNNKDVKKEYPVLYSTNDTNNGLPNEAHLWIVNQERYKNIYENPRQLFGCIFNVWYDGIEMNFTRISDGVGRKCTPVCISNICNGGKCYETYDGVPVCDCTKAFLIGTYCNDSITSMNIRSSESLYFPLLKVSWKSSSKEILLIKNSKIQIQLNVNRTILLLNYTHKNGSYEGTLSRSYIPNREYTLIINFMETSTDIQLFNNGSLLNISIPSNRDKSYEVFTSLLLQSGDGYIGLSYKHSPRDFIWYKKDVEQYEIITTEKSTTTIIRQNFTIFPQNVIKFEKMSKGTIVSIVIPTVISVILSIILIIVYFRVKKQRRRRKRKAAEQQELLLQQLQQEEDEKVKECVLWVAARGGYIPPRAIDAGGGCFVARALYRGKLIPGSIREGSECCVPYGEVHKTNTYEVLVESETSEANSVEWHFAKGRDIPQYAIIAGRDYGGPLYIARCKVEEETVVGEYSPYYGYRCIPYRGDVRRIKNNIEVLCYRPQNI